jgi:transmembrane sensor
MPEIKIKELLKKYLEGSATPEEEKLVGNWYASLGNDNNNDQVHLLEAERRRLRNFYWNSLKSKIGQSENKSFGFWPNLTRLAAAIGAIILVSLYVIPSYVPDSDLLQEQAPVSMKEIFNNTHTNRKISLPDSSGVLLFPGSRLQYSDEFDLNERKIFLSGQAFFEISHDPAKPFYVFANEVVAKVLGTSFSVIAYPEDISIRVEVKTGKVSVYANPEKKLVLPTEEKVILTPNQQAVYTRDTKKVSRMLVKDPQMIIAEEEVKKIRFEGAPVPEIFIALEKMYGVDIVFEEEVFSNCSITTSVSGKDLYERVDVICEIIGATYTVEDTRVLISGAGCN